LGVHENIAPVVLTVDAYLCPPGWSAPHDADEELHLWFFHGGQQAGLHLDVDNLMQQLGLDSQLDHWD
jgi:hypothetical protein